MNFFKKIILNYFINKNIKNSMKKNFILLNQYRKRTDRYYFNETIFISYGTKENIIKAKEAADIVFNNLISTTTNIIIKNFMKNFNPLSIIDIDDQYSFLIYYPIGFGKPFASISNTKNEILNSELYNSYIKNVYETNNFFVEKSILLNFGSGVENKVKILNIFEKEKDIEIKNVPILMINITEWQKINNILENYYIYNEELPFKNSFLIRSIGATVAMFASIAENKNEALSNFNNKIVPYIENKIGKIYPIEDSPEDNLLIEFNKNNIIISNINE